MHPYTKALMSAVPIPDPKRRNVKSERILLKGDVPSPISPPSGCRFHTRCWKATEICKTTEPPLLELKPGQQVACHHPENFEDQAPQDTVLLSAAKEAAALVADEVLAESAETSAAVAAELESTEETPEPAAETTTEPAEETAAEEAAPEEAAPEEAAAAEEAAAEEASETAAVDESDSSEESGTGSQK
jgi:peptide/nickel transport system ATP-binding protein